ncbi:MAG: hypothetical protein ACO3JH_01460, partial [Flavobacteriaceae bacterium]
MKSPQIKTFIFVLWVSITACKGDGYTAYSILASEGLGTKPIDFILPQDRISESPKNIFIRLQNDNNYPFANIFLVATIQEGEMVVSQDTLEYTMAEPDGKW